MEVQELKEQIAKWFYNKAFHDPLDFTWEEATELVPDDRVLTVLRIENVKKFRQDAANILLVAIIMLVIIIMKNRQKIQPWIFFK